eukprot:CAMPEP_0202959048 /NCGR_PEP_ID=MMETSP1396-20130829/3320_1 /ASSEMBLY_ACC=CAM_ASM_000872 /TAXON_ID= /ORGANISM="Pseudokeronopsis sp., Strain Brazil" /LENGTH=123 /DNA_ID=CAMNT_0049677429 /DNA_START=23 /DNA_END=394 /DNA_ORIENTATION=+
MAIDKSEVQEQLNHLMSLPGAEGYVIINNDGIPVKYHPEESLPAVQYAALIADLVMKTKHTLKHLNSGDADFEYLRMRTKQDTEMIITDYIHPGSGNEYILVCIQRCKFQPEEVKLEGEAENK